MSRLNLDWLRGLAALAVLVSHILLFYPAESLTSLKYLGCMGVEVFFVLSGFLIALSWHANPSISDYALRRAKRILPLMWFVMAAVFFLMTPIFLDWSLVDPAHWLMILLHFAGLQSAIPLEIPGLFIGLPLWTLTVELCFYAILPIWWRYFVRAPAAWVVASFAIEVAWRLSAEIFVDKTGLSVQWALYLPMQLPGQAFSFAVGMLLAYLSLYRKESRYSELLIWAGLFGLASGVVWADEIWNSGVSMLLYPVSTGMIVWGATGTRVRFGGAYYDCLSLTGRVSYSLYLWHFPVLFLLIRIAHQVNAPLWAYAIVSIAVSMMVAIISFKHIEQPFMKGSHA